MVNAARFFASNKSAGDSLTSSELQRRAIEQGQEPGDGRYVGTIAAVSEDVCYNKFKRHHAPQLAATFADGERCIVNPTMGRTLIALFGEDTAGWVGKCICIFLRAGKRTDPATGRPQLERVVMRANPVAPAPAPTFETFTRDNPPADYDDSPEALAFRAEAGDE